MRDNGGVHTNSGIHNKAAYLLLTARKSDGSQVLLPDEIARMYYFVLVQLADNATFSDCRKKLTETVRTVKQGAPDLAQIESGIDTAYDAVGIS